MKGLRLKRTDRHEFADPATEGYLVGNGWLLWRAKSIGGLVLWGAQSQAQAREIVDACTETLRSTGMQESTFTAILDVRRTGAMDLSAFATFDTWLLQMNAKHPQLHVVVLCDRSPAAAAVFGLVKLAAPRIVFAVKDDLKEIAKNAHAPDGLLDEVAAVVETAAAPSTLAVLHAALVEHRANLSLSQAARALGMSGRTLQRALEKDGTTFERERAAIKRRLFEESVADDSLKIDSVAASFGFGSVRAFSTAFRRTVGVSPRAFRSRA